MEVDFEHRCHLTMQVKHCNYIMNFFNYFEIMYCSIDIQSKLEERLIMGLFGIIMILLTIMIGHLVDKYIEPALKILSVKMYMSEYLAGVTLLSLGNSFADLIVNLMPIRGHAPIYTISLSNALAVILLSGGMVCFLRPFKLNGHSVIRDLLFLLLAAELTIYMIFSDTKTTKPESISLALLYPIYLFVLFVDHNLLHEAISTLYKEIDELQNQPYTPRRKDLIKEKLKKLHEFEQEVRVVVHNNSIIYRYNSSNLETYWRDYRKQMSNWEIQNIQKMDENITRNILYNFHNPKNMFLFEEFLTALIPINIVDWKFSGWCHRIFLIILSPIALFCAIFIPIVDYRQDKHGWSKLLNCTQIITNPILCFVLVEAMFNNTYTKRYPVLTLTNAIWTLWFTVPLAILVFFHSRTDRPPTYHLLFLSLTVVSSMLFLAICATELEVLFAIIGLVFHMTEDFVASSIRSLAGAMGDVIFNTHLAMHGYEKMAFAASLAAPLFIITVCIGIPCYFNSQVHKTESAHWLYGIYGENSYIFFTMAIFTALGWTLTLNFSARRSVGIFSYILFMLFLLFNALAEWDLIHEMARDKIFKPI
ncbi:mitochondrial sodium/calcium exchanger protein-like [Drosophila innubila]|uniref:mitochondrial sodium/calcium exchanger protein-like n=1 Tax=Drosophila innubila TaxID=198719 RepID=UPI00148C1D65|nr:mitochondrial sodium/calcium exchanger protein-like [Drosophila innubila]